LIKETDGQRLHPWRNRRSLFGGNVGGNLAWRSKANSIFQMVIPPF
jgi:hypothetical protein